MTEAPPGPASDDQQAVQDLRELQEALHEADMERLKSPKTPRKVKEAQTCLHAFVSMDLYEFF